MQRFLVYFWATADMFSVKIGFCISNLDKNRAELQRGCPQKIELLGVIQCEDKEDMLSSERTLHKRFKEHNTIGEWHVLASEISEYIQEFADYELGQQILNEDHKIYIEKDRERYKNDPEARKLRNKRLREQKRERYQNDPEFRMKELEKGRKWREENREICRNCTKKWRNKNRVKLREYDKKYQNERYQNDPEFRVSKIKRNREYGYKYRQRKKSQRLAENTSQKPLQLELF